MKSAREATHSALRVAEVKADVAKLKEDLDHVKLQAGLAQSTAEEKRLKAAKKEYCTDKWAEELEYTTAQAGRVDTAEQTVDSFVENYVPGFVRSAATTVDDWATDKFQNMLRLRVAIARPD